MGKRRNLRKRVVMVTKHVGDHTVLEPYEMFSSMERCEEWLSKQDDRDMLVAEWMDGIEALSYVEDNMLWGYKQTIQSCTCDEEAEKALENLYESDEWKMHERWLDWLGA